MRSSNEIIIVREMNIEEVKVGCFQMILLLLLGINYAIVAMSHALPEIHNYTPTKFYCDSMGNKSYGCHASRNSSSLYNISIDSFCTDRKYTFITEHGETSVVTEWNLVCENNYLAHFGTIVYDLGILVGALIAGFLADSIGRLPVQAICLYVQSTMAVALYIVQNYPGFLALRAVQGVFVQGLQDTTYILSIELFQTQKRTLIALSMHVFGGLGVIFLSGLNHIITDWRILQLGISVPSAITVLYIWIIPESPRWLLAKGKTTESDMALEKIIKYNNCCKRKKENLENFQEEKETMSLLTTTPGVQKMETSSPSSSKDNETRNSTQRTIENNFVDEDKIECESSKDKTNDVDHENIVEPEKQSNTNTKNSLFIKYGVIVIFQWITLSLVYHSNTYLISRFQPHRHVKLISEGSTEIIISIFTYFIISNCGRRLPMGLYQFFNGIICIGIIICMINTNYSSHWINYSKTLLILLGRTIAIGTIFIAQLYTLEIFPTVKRATCLGVCAIFFKIGSLSVSYTLFVTAKISIVLPLTIIGILSVCSGIIVLVLPETFNQILPDKFEHLGGKREKKLQSEEEKDKILREKLFTENLVDAGNGILVNFSDNRQ